MTTEDERSTFRTQLTDAEDWLYMDPEAETGTADTFKSKLKTLTAVGDPIKARAYEAARRPDRVSGAKLLIDLVKKAKKDWPAARPWLNTTHVDKLTDLVRASPSQLYAVVCTAMSLFVQAWLQRTRLTGARLSAI